jgi:hypothetical protein
MPRLRLDLDRETFEALAAQAIAQRRTAPWQAEVILRRALGLPFPFPTSSDSAATTPPGHIADE